MHVHIDMEHEWQGKLNEIKDVILHIYIREIERERLHVHL